jgi:hypothetical protein
MLYYRTAIGEMLYYRTAIGEMLYIIPRPHCTQKLPPALCTIPQAGQPTIGGGGGGIVTPCTTE